MLGNEERTLAARLLKAGDYLYSAPVDGVPAHIGHKVEHVAPTSDPWIHDGIDVHLEDGSTVPVMPHTLVRVIGDVRELAARLARIA